MQPTQYPKQIEWTQHHHQQQQQRQPRPIPLRHDSIDVNDAFNDEEEEEEEEAPTTRKPVRYVFWDVESELLEAADDDNVGHVDWEDGEEGERAAAAACQKSHRPLLVCADVICERCIAAGIDLDREPKRRAPGCFCGVPWRLGDLGRHACMQADPQLVAAGQMPIDGKNPRRLAFHRFQQQQQPQQNQAHPRPVNSAIAQFVDLLLHTGPLMARTIALAHNGVGIEQALKKLLKKLESDCCVCVCVCV